nr:DUF6456 domain-containing protein [Jannaschia aquimarina]
MYPHASEGSGGPIPNWIPDPARAYIAHTSEGRSLREVAAEYGCTASTILRQVRRLKARREDPLVDDILDRLGAAVVTKTSSEGYESMSAMPQRAQMIDDDTLKREAARVLRRLCEGDAILLVGIGMPQAVVLKSDSDPTRLATLPRAVAQAFVLKEWVSCYRAGKVTRYRITEMGRCALKRILAERHNQKVAARGLAEAPSPFLTQNTTIEEVTREGRNGAERLRVNLAESPLGALARRREKDGSPFLTAALVLAGETLRDDFERAQMGPRVGQNWDRFLTAGARGDFGSDSRGEGNESARHHVAEALRELGPGLGDVALRVCCFLEGVESTEKRLGWAARSGKIVLRIALQRLHAHYVEKGRL